MPRPRPKDLGDQKKPLRLTHKQLAFVDAYLACWNGTAAARSAGYQGNDATLAQIAYENLQKPRIKEAIKRRVSLNAMTSAEALGLTADIARGNLGKYIQISRDGTLSLNYQRLVNDGKSHLVKSVSTRSDGKIGRVEFYSALQALDMILKAEGVYDEGVTVNLPPFDPEAWKKQARDRLKEVEEMPDPYEDLTDEGQE